MKTIGLTGGIASGKTTVAKIIKKMGVRVINADDLAHQTIEPNTPGYLEVVKKFGSEILKPDGEIDRRLLGELVFDDQHARESLEQIIHPQVIAAIKMVITTAREEGLNLLVVEVPLLFEIGLTDLFDQIWLVSVDPEEQIRRVCGRDNLTEIQARKRLAAQMPLVEKEERCDAVIYNDLGQSELEQQVINLLLTVE